MWEISNNRQLMSFLISFLFGVCYALVYTFLKAVRRVVKHSAVGLFFEDIIFFILAGFVTFLLLLALVSGEIRFYILLGIFLGFALFHLAFSDFLSGILSVVLRFFVTVFSRIFSAFDLMLAFLGDTGLKMAVYCAKKLSFCYKYLKNILKATVGLVYTKEVNKVGVDSAPEKK